MVEWIWFEVAPQVTLSMMHDIRKSIFEMTLHFDQYQIPSITFGPHLVRVPVVYFILSFSRELPQALLKLSQGVRVVRVQASIIAVVSQSSSMVGNIILSHWNLFAKSRSGSS